MSYILDALRKADAERERGSVPGIHAQPLAAALPSETASRIGGGLGDDTRRRLLAGALAVLVLVLALALARWLMATPNDDPAVQPGVVPAPAWAGPPADAPPAAAAATAAAAPPDDRSIPPVPVELQAAAPRARPAAPAETALATAPAPAAAPAGRVATASSGVVRSGSAAPLPQTTASTTGTTTADANRIYQPRELPEEIRRDLPTLTVGGSTYSQNAASRMLIINGQVFHENDPLTPDLVLERIQLRSAVLRYKGLRYEIAF